MQPPEQRGVSVVALEALTWRALRQGAPGAGAGIEELARRLGLPAATIREALAGLLGKGLVRRTGGSQ